MISPNTDQSFQIPLNWRSVFVERESFPWHRKIQRSAKYRELIRGPQVYRWVLKNNLGATEAVYIGQSEAFHSRIAGYRTPTKTNPNDTDVILNNAFSDTERNGGSVELQFLEICPFVINGQLIESKSLANQEIRLLLESLAILTAKAEGQKLLNRLSKNANEKAIIKVLDGIPKHKRLPLLESAIAKLRNDAT